MNKHKMESNLEMKEGRFSETSYNYASILFRIKGSLLGKDVTISISVPKDKKYIKRKIFN